MKHEELKELEELWKLLTKTEQKELEYLVPATEDKHFYKALKTLVNNLFDLYEDYDKFKFTSAYRTACNILLRIKLIEESDKHDFNCWCNTNGLKK